MLPWDGQRDEAEKFWDEVSICLILIEPDDTDEALGDVDEDMETLLAYALDNPEFVIVLPHETDPHVVAVVFMLTMVVVATSLVRQVIKQGSLKP
ncbi:hypothetical protein [Vibrio taketomensis]|uniref:hypothetical protein n=1 Tax=Vibrio taketomensis TaxID=2572923 RepID=UPI001E2FC10D|nr:hypothetical protein [Vibrio taketomensis]